MLDRLGLPPEIVLAVVMPMLVAAGVWAVLRPDRFVLYAVMTTQILPMALFTPAGLEIAIADLLLVVALAGWLVASAAGRAPGPWLHRNPILVPALIYAGVTAISTAWSVNQRETVLHTVQIVQIVVVLPIVFATLPRTLKSIRSAFLVFIAATCAMAVVTFALYLPKALAGNLEGQYLPGLNKNAIGSYLGAGLVLAYGMLLGERSGRTRTLLAIASGVEAVGLFASVSRGSIIGAVVAVLAVSFLLRRGRLLTVGAVAVAAIFFLTVVGYASGVDRSLSGSYDSSLVRGYSFANAVEKIGDRPVLGLGAGAYQDFIPEIPIILPDPNNMFLLTLAEMGLIGFAALLLVLARYLRIWLRASRLPDDGAVLGVAAGGVTLSFFVHFQFDVTWTRGTTSLAFVMLGLILAALRLSERHAPAEIASTSPVGKTLRTRHLAGVS